MGRRIGMTGVGAAMLLQACATLPDFEERDYVKLESLFYSVEQELCEALALIAADQRVSGRLREAGVDIEKQYAKATAGLKLVRIVDAAGNASFVIPVTYGTAGLGLGLSGRNVNTVDTTVSVYYPFAELECNGEIADPPERIAGGLGLREWVLNTTVALINVQETPASYTYDVSFVVASDGRARPSLSLAPPNFRLIGADASLGAAQQREHSLSVTIKDVSVSGGKGRGGGVPREIRDALDREEGLQILRRVRD